MNQPELQNSILLTTPADARLRMQSIDPWAKNLCDACAIRASTMIQEIKRRNPQAAMLDPEPLQISMDFAVAYVRRGLRLRDLLESSDLDFLGELVTITHTMSQSLNRVACAFPDDVHLKFATKRNA